MTKLIIGFDSAWTCERSGALVGVLEKGNGEFQELGSPQKADFAHAMEIIEQWRKGNGASTTVIFLDQPTIVKYPTGQRPVENIIGSIVGRRGGGMFPANTGRIGMFDEDAPIWPFVERFGGPADPLKPISDFCVVETYPVLIAVALNWTLANGDGTTRLAKYNPARRKTFSPSDWCHICCKVSSEFKKRKLSENARWIDGVVELEKPRKEDQDRLDACICLLAALHFAERKTCLMIGNVESGYIVVPYSESLCLDIEERCRRTGRLPANWVKNFIADFV